MVRTSALKPPLKFAELFICPPPPHRPRPLSYRCRSFRRSLKFQRDFLSVHRPSPLGPPFRVPFRLLLSRHLVKRFFSFEISLLGGCPRVHSPRRATDRKRLIYLMQCLPLTVPRILRFPFSMPDPRYSPPLSFPLVGRRIFRFRWHSLPASPSPLPCPVCVGKQWPWPVFQGPSSSPRDRISSDEKDF